jgi:hypothetical protein
MLLPELWVKIFEQLDCATILNIKLTCRYFNNLVNQHDIYMKRKFSGFPRPEGACRTIKICGMFLENNISKYLQKEKVDLIRGDAIHFASYVIEDKYYIYDGQQLLNLGDNENIFLPNKFRIINNNVPVDYWENIQANYTLWFDPTEIREQLICSINPITKILEVTFYYNEKQYQFYCTGKYMCANNDRIDFFKNIIDSHKLLLLRKVKHGIQLREDDYVEDKSKLSRYDYLTSY